MELIITGRGIPLTPVFRAVVGRKLAKLARLVPQTLEARLTCSAEKFRRTVRLTLRTKRELFAGTATAGDLLTAMDEAVETVSRQVREDKDRRRLGRRRLARVRRVARVVQPVA